MTGTINEIFSSVQGEGILVGCRQVFIRLSGCNLRCAYCDTPAKETGYCLVEQHPGERDFVRLPNPMEAVSVAATIADTFDLSGHHSVSFTGGEPLLHKEFIRELAPLLDGKTRQGLYLETNGTLPDELEEVVHLFDIIGMDIKLPSITGLPTFWEKHRRFLEIAARRQVFVKVVVGEGTTYIEINQVAKLINECSKEILLIIQPVTPNGIIKDTISPAMALKLQSQAMMYLSNVLIIPQTHKTMNQL